MKFDETYTIEAGEMRTISTINNGEVVVTNNIDIEPTNEVQFGIAPYASDDLNILDHGESTSIRGSFSVVLLNNAMGPVAVYLDGELRVEEVQYYDKLVRGKVPDQIDDGEPKTRTVKGDELRQKLLDKVVEEAEEVRDDPSVEELADLQEVLLSVMSELDITEGELYRHRRNKKDQKGGFTEGVVLESIVPR
jgi:predicted house-cleaning noncanonical NTP pyrophosphatase (MazG superfamily)